MKINKLICSSMMLLMLTLLTCTLAGCGGGGGSSPGTFNSSSSSTSTMGLFLVAGHVGGFGTLDGVGSDAWFYNPNSVAVDASGNVFVADTFNNTIRKITPAGVVTTVAGQAGISGSVDGAGTASQFNSPRGITIDASDNLYVADTDNQLIRKITPAGLVTTIAGQAGVSGATDGEGAAAQFNYPGGIVVDSVGNLYVADTYNNTIRVITPSGMVTTLAGKAGTAGFTDGTGSAALFHFPTGITVSINGYLCVTDTFNNTIREVTAAGVVTTLAGQVGISGISDGTGSAALFNNPVGIAGDTSGNLYVADSYNYTIREITPAGVVTTIAGQAGIVGSTDGTGSAALFNTPYGIAADTNGMLYIADTYNNVIRKMNSTGTVSTLAGLAGVSGLSDGTGAASQFNYPFGVTSDAAGNLYVADTYNNVIRKITPAGVVTTIAGQVGVSGAADGEGAAAQFNYPSGITVDVNGNLYVADTYSHTIREITPAGMVTTIAGQAGVSGATDGEGAAAQFNHPTGIVVDSAGNLYVADTYNDTIREITPAGVVTTIAGQAGVREFADGTGADARFSNPNGIAVDASGNLYVADTYNQVIRKITAGGIVSTIAGQAGIAGAADGMGVDATFYRPFGITAAANGDLYVADTDNDTIRRITSAGVVTTVVGQAGSAGFMAGALPGVISTPVAVTVHGTSLYILMNNAVVGATIF